MNENIDLTKILKNCPKETKFYSTLYGEVRVNVCNQDVEYPIILLKCISPKNNTVPVCTLTKTGKYNRQFDGECTLFPSKDQRDWSKFTAPWYKNEQKSADKIEPRFKVGDWITIDKPCQIINIHDNGNYIVQYCDDEKTHELSKNFCESYFHFWTIQDVKDGDVLVNGSNIFIFHFINNRRLMGYCHVNMDDGNLYNDIGRNECFCTIDAPVTPATKEQRDALMKAISDAEYEWDIEKKELKKKRNR